MASPPPAARPSAFAVERRAPRVTYEKEVVLKPRYRSNNVQAFVANLSERGALLVSAEMFTLGTEILFYLPIPIRNGKKQTLCMVTGKVVRVDGRYQTYLRAYGIEFLANSSPGTQKLLKTFVERI